jgi:hypothetical protein
MTAMAERLPVACRLGYLARFTERWEVGRRIVEAEQKGKRRADYGARLIERLAADLCLTLIQGAFFALPRNSALGVWLFFPLTDRSILRCFVSVAGVWPDEDRQGGCCTTVSALSDSDVLDALAMGDAKVIVAELTLLQTSPRDSVESD